MLPETVHISEVQLICREWYGEWCTREKFLMCCTSDRPLGSTDQRLQVDSSYFDPTYFLSIPTQHVVLPKPQVMALDNLSKYSAQYKSDAEGDLSHSASARDAILSIPPDDTMETRTFDVKENVETIQKNPFKEMTNSLKGPLSLLQDLMNEVQRARILIRFKRRLSFSLHTSYLRKIREMRLCTGYIVAFDKHFNCLLRDVVETRANLSTR